MAFDDLRDGLARTDFWRGFAWNDVRARYRRSRIGEFWMVICIAIFVFAVGLVFSTLFGMSLATYLPYMSSGYILWLLFNTLVVEGCQTFIGAESFLKQQRIPLTALVLRNLHRAFIVFAHNAAVVFLTVVIFGVKLGNYN